MKKAVFILMGQSNATGHGIPMAPEDRMETPLKNVFGLHRQPNQSLTMQELVWSGYTSHGMNLAETQDHTYSVANCLASRWQKAIDGGAALPDLYIIQIAIGAQGVREGYMWHPDRAPKLIPGKLGTVDISLHPYSMHIFSLLKASLGEFSIIGLHWRGGENDAYDEPEQMYDMVQPVYQRLLEDWNRALEKPPIILHRIVAHERYTDRDPSGRKLESMHIINRVFDEMAEKYPNVSVFDVRSCPEYIPDVRGNGIFKSDMVHFTPEVNAWVAEKILEEQL